MLNDLRVPISRFIVPEIVVVDVTPLDINDKVLLLTLQATQQGQ